MSPLSAGILRICSTAALCVLLIRPDPASAQTVWMGGSSGLSGGNVNPPGVVTILQMSAANLDGRVTTATFGWSASPCPAAVKIKFFRPSAPPPVRVNPPPPFTFLTERGPFDVTESVTTTCCLGGPRAAQTVTLSPPVEVRAGDLVAITNLTTCGSPIYVYFPFEVPTGSSFTVPDDVTSTVTSGTLGRSIDLRASGTGPALGLLFDTFLVTLTAMDTRTGMTADGVPNLLGVEGRAGYFSLPAFTGDSIFPEVVVKMADMRDTAGGGSYWFFHAPLTDVQYTLTVKHQRTGAVKTYSKPSASPGQLCGSADTSAFPP